VSEAAAEGSNVAGPSPEHGVRTVFFGSGSFAVPILDALATLSGVRVEAVVSAPDRPVGRKAVITPTPVTARARELGLPVLQPVRVRRPEAVDSIAAFLPQLIVLADYGQLIPPVLLSSPVRGFLNLHPSALPRWRGAAPIPATILAGDTGTAVTLIVVTEEMDAGPIVAVEPLDVHPDDTAVALEERAAEAAARLLRRALPEWLAGRLQPRPQPDEGVTLTRPLRREDGLLDATRTAVQLERQVRAYQPWPGAYLEIELGRLIVWRARVVASEPGDDPGRLVSTGRDGVGLATAEGRLLLDEVQLAGKTRVSAAEFRRGYPKLVR
jgi:methionyl-tRNA formyltransferase